MILYEYPFNERIRTYLRLEHLFRRLAELLPRSHPLDHHYAIQTIFEIMDVASRADLKSDLLQELERQKQILLAYQSNPNVEPEMLNAILAEVDRASAALSASQGRTGQNIRENEWLMSVRGRTNCYALESGACARIIYWRSRKPTLELS